MKHSRLRHSTAIFCHQVYTKSSNPDIRGGHHSIATPDCDAIGHGAPLPDVTQFGSKEQENNIVVVVGGDAQ